LLIKLNKAYVCICAVGRITDMSSNDLISEELPLNVVEESVKDDLCVTEVTSVDCIPDEILEYILSLTSPYCDFKSALLVSKRWYSVIKSMLPEFTVCCLL